jgi:hypothetical protein
MILEPKEKKTQPMRSLGSNRGRAERDVFRIEPCIKNKTKKIS